MYEKIITKCSENIKKKSQVNNPTIKHLNKAKETASCGSCSACRTLRSPQTSTETASLAFTEAKALGKESCAVSFMQKNLGNHFTTGVLNPAIQKKCSGGGSCPECKAEEEAEKIVKSIMKMESPDLSKKLSADYTPSVEQNEQGVISEIISNKGTGQRLDENTRSFMEPRLGYDFSPVRIHTDSYAAKKSNELNAEAFTIGRDVFFNAGRYNPSSIEGKKILTHELTHVVQQGSGSSAGFLIQRAKIPYTRLTWGDFKGKAPAKSKWAAETSTEINLPGWKPSQEVEDTGKDCKIGKKASKEFKAKLSLAPTIFDSIEALMVQEKSWVRDWSKDNGHAKCVGQGKECADYFDKKLKEIEKDCKKSVKECNKAFKGGALSFSMTFDEEKVEVKSKGECETKLLAECKELSKKGVSFSRETDERVKIAEAKEKEECKKEYFEQCVKFYRGESEKLLKHEQGHFDITNVIAPKVREAVKDKARTLTVEETKCGKVETVNAAIKSFNALKAGDVLKKIFKDWNEQKKNAGKDYDDQTDHGLNEQKQTGWEDKIAGGLSDYKVPSE